MREMRFVIGDFLIRFGKWLSRRRPGRPRAAGPRLWDVEGVSRATWYRRARKRRLGKSDG
jgi:hypothetical protein